MCRRDTWGLGCVFHSRMRGGCCTEKGVGFLFPFFLLVGGRFVGWRGTVVRDDGCFFAARFGAVTCLFGLSCLLRQLGKKGLGCVVVCLCRTV